MTLIDANLLIYAYNPAAEHHAAARRWLEATIGAGLPVRLAWMTVLAFVRIMTSTQIFRRPLSIEEAAAIVDQWLAQSNVDVLEAGEQHWALLRQTLVDGQASGSLVSDAHLAALAIEHGATLATTDRDFARFAGLKTTNPIDLS